jgi:hypothetical protein
VAVDARDGEGVSIFEAIFRLRLEQSLHESLPLRARRKNGSSAAFNSRPEPIHGDNLDLPLQFAQALLDPFAGTEENDLAHLEFDLAPPEGQFLVFVSKHFRERSRIESGRACPANCE